MNDIALRVAIAYKTLALRLRDMNDERGATAVEYALMVGLIAAVIVGAVTLLGDNISGLFGETADQVDGAGAGG